MTLKFVEQRKVIDLHVMTGSRFGGKTYKVSALVLKKEHEIYGN